jgi:serine/threonine-protein kinase HipA
LTLPRRKAIEVHADWSGLGGPFRMGTLHAAPGRRGELLSFEYDAEWLSSGWALQLDPRLQLFAGEQHAPEGSFGLFLDSAPDRWGRTLQDRRESRRAREEGRTPRPLHESDYLLGVHDVHRMGALRFRASPEGPFLDADEGRPAPPWTSLRELEAASLALEEEGADEDPRCDEWLRVLLAPGSSLGGARPKAGVLDPKGHPWLAKFPSRADREDVGGWETVVSRLARRCGVEVPATEASRFGSSHHTFLARRFDRADDGGRVHFASAMTLLDRKDGDSHREGASYLELAELIARDGSRPDADLAQLWLRIVFFMCVSNVDDHLRNHGFLLDPGRGWRLAPAYDVNPVATGDGLTLNVSEADNAQDLDLALAVSAHFRVKGPVARELVERVRGTARGWAVEARRLGLRPREIDRMGPAFRLA